MQIANIEVMHCDAGWRPWSFIKITTDEGLIGWSEVTDSHGSPRGIAGVIEDLKQLIVGEDPRNTEKIYWFLYAHTRQSPGSIIQKAIGGIENALLDIKAKALGVPVYQLFGGTIRSTIPLYWSHWGTTRVRAWKEVGQAKLTCKKGIASLVLEAKDFGYKVIKTNILIIDPEGLYAPYVHMPGFGKSLYGYPELNFDQRLLGRIEKYIALVREYGTEDLGIIFDANFNFKTEGYIQLAKTLEKFNLMWLEIDSYDPEALRQIKDSTRIPICSGENLYTMRDYRPYFERHAMDIASVDVIWNGFYQSLKVAHMAELYEMNVTPHNYYSHLATFISAQFSACIPNLRIMEIDVDDVSWKDELVSFSPDVKNGYLEISDRPGWGTEVNEDVLKAHPWPK